MIKLLEKIKNKINIKELKIELKEANKKIEKLEKEKRELIDLKNVYLSKLRGVNLELGRLKKKK